MEKRPRPAPEPETADGPDPQELLVAVARGDRQAFSQLYEVIAAPIFGLVQRIVLDAAQSEEVAQEVLVEVWRTATQYRPQDRKSVV